MIIRPADDAWLAINQPSHAWISGQMARAWGNEQFFTPQPREAFILATTLHDIGWETWDAAPPLHPDGRPVNFVEASLDATNVVWRDAVAHVLRFDPYAALLVSMHASLVYRRRMESGVDPEALALPQLDWQADFQDTLIARLQAHPLYGAAVALTPLQANYRLLRACDLLSLALCTGPLQDGVIPDVPAEDAQARVEMTYTARDESTLALNPYPFATPELRVAVNARALTRQTFPDEGAYHNVLAEAPWQTLQFVLLPG